MPQKPSSQLKYDGKTSHDSSEPKKPLDSEHLSQLSSSKEFLNEEGKEQTRFLNKLGGFGSLN